MTHPKRSSVTAAELAMTYRNEVRHGSRDPDFLLAEMFDEARRESYAAGFEAARARIVAYFEQAARDHEDCAIQLRMAGRPGADDYDALALNDAEVAKIVRALPLTGSPSTDIDPANAPPRESEAK